MKNSKLYYSITAVLAILLSIFILVSVFPNSDIMVLKELPVYKEINNLKDEINSLKSDTTEKIKLLEKENTKMNNIALAEEQVKILYNNLETAKNNDFIKMQSMAVNFIIDLLNNNESNLKELTSKKLFDVYKSAKNTTVIDKNIDLKRFFTNLSGKKLIAFDQINQPFSNDNGYTLSILFSCENFNYDSSIHGIIHFVVDNGKILIDDFGKDA